MTLVSILPNCENTEKLALLNLFGLIAKDKPSVRAHLTIFAGWFVQIFRFQLLEPSVPQLCEQLTSQSTALATLQVFYNVAQVKPLILAEHTAQYKATAENYPKTVMSAVQVMCAVAKVKQVSQCLYVLR